MGGNTVMQEPGKPLITLGGELSSQVVDRLELARHRRHADLAARRGSVPTTLAADRRPQDAPYFKSLPPVSPEYLRKLRRNFSLEPRSYDELMRLRRQDVGRCDMARLNLLCATGLPGTEDLEVDEYLHTLDMWSVWVAQKTERDLDHFHRNPKQFNNSEPYCRVLSMTTTLQLQFGVHYEERLRKWGTWDWKDSRDVLLNGPLGFKRSGSCASLPAILNAVARRLGYPVYLVHAPSHDFSRWDGYRSYLHENLKWHTRFNIEYHGNGLIVHDDEHYRHRPIKWTPEVIEAERRRGKPLYLRCLEPAEELAGILGDRFGVLMAHKRFDEAFMAAQKGGELAPHNPLYAVKTQTAHHEKLVQALEPWGMTEEHFYQMLGARQLGSPLKFPWEIGNNIPTPCSLPNSLIADPIKAAIIAYEATHQNGRLLIKPLLSTIPERTLQRPEELQVQQ